MNSYFSGEKLYGEDFSIGEIKKWHEDEREGYAGLLGGHRNYNYGYHHVNILYGYRFLKGKRYPRVLGIGSAYGNEFEPIKDLIDTLYILEPSENLISDDIWGVKPFYVKPNIDGTMDFPDNYFDLIVCFDTLHHIPNVSYIVSESFRCLNPGGILLMKEPINSMGDWRERRAGLTKHERGIPLDYLRASIKAIGFKIVRENVFFTMTSFLVRKTEIFLGQPIFKYKTYVLIDKYLSKVLKWNISYHPKNMLKRIAPSSVFFVLSK